MDTKGERMNITALVRRSDLCPTCENRDALCYDPVTDTWCPTCGGHGFVYECDADFKKRMMEHILAAHDAAAANPVTQRYLAGCQEKPLDYFEKTIRDGCSDEN